MLQRRFQSSPDAEVGRYENWDARVMEYRVFQSSPDAEVGRYQPWRADAPGRRGFNPRPTLRSGAIRPLVWDIETTGVSILARR